MTLVRMCDERFSPTNEAVLSRIAALENKIKSGALSVDKPQQAQAQSAMSQSQPTPPQSSQSQQSQSQPQSTQPAQPQPSPAEPAAPNKERVPAAPVLGGLRAEMHRARPDARQLHARDRKGLYGQHRRLCPHPDEQSGGASHNHAYVFDSARGRSTSSPTSRSQATR